MSTDTKTELAKDEGSGKERKPRKRPAFLRGLPGLFLIAFVLALVIKTFLFQAFYIPSPSMKPTLVRGDRVIVNKVVYHLGDIHRGDVVVIDNPHPGQLPHRSAVGAFIHWLAEGLGFDQTQNEHFIKRVIGLPGDTIEYTRGIVYVNGKALEEPYVARQDPQHYGPVTVPAGRLFLMGDNRIHSDDSRMGLGMVPVSDVVGKAQVIIWPPSRAGWLH